MDNRLNAIVLEFNALRVKGAEASWKQGKLLQEGRDLHDADIAFGKWRSANFADLKETNSLNLMKLARFSTWEPIKALGLTICYRLADDQVRLINAADEYDDKDALVQLVGLDLKEKPTKEKSDDQLLKNELVQLVKALREEIAELRNHDSEPTKQQEETDFLIRVVQGEKPDNCPPHIRIQHSDPVWAVGIEGDLDKTSIKKAGRKLAHILHPDKGGDKFHYGILEKHVTTLLNRIA